MNRVVLVTGVAGGIGRATAQVFDRAGWHVIGVDRKPAQEIVGVDTYFQTDAAAPDQIAHLFESIGVQVGRLDALVNNAAIQICKPLVEMSVEEWDETLGVNTRAPFLFAKHAHPFLKASKGAVVNVSSVHAVATSVGIAAYAASKGALLAMTRAMALEWGLDEIRVNVVLPGAVDTPMLHDGLNRGHIEGRSVEELVRGLGRKHVMGRVGQPDEIGRAILFLADSEQSSFMTGQAMVVDGGATARLSTE